MDPGSETNALLFFCFHGKLLTMAANPNLSSSVNWRSMETNVCIKISFNMYSLPPNHDNHIC